MPSNTIILKKCSSLSEKPQSEIRSLVEVQKGDVLLDIPQPLKDASVQTNRKLCKTYLKWILIIIVIIIVAIFISLVVYGNFINKPNTPINMKCPAITKVPRELKIHQNYIGDDLLLHPGYVKAFKHLPCGLSDEFPWMMKVLWNGSLACAAALITKNWAISAAHCLHGDM